MQTADIPLMHPLTFPHPGSGQKDGKLGRVFQTSLSPALPGGSLGIPGPDGIQNSSIGLWVNHQVCFQNASKGGFPSTAHYVFAHTSVAWPNSKRAGALLLHLGLARSLLVH